MRANNRKENDSLSLTKRKITHENNLEMMIIQNNRICSCLLFWTTCVMFARNVFHSIDWDTNFECEINKNESNQYWHLVLTANGVFDPWSHFAGVCRFLYIFLNFEFFVDKSLDGNVCCGGCVYECWFCSQYGCNTKNNNVIYVVIIVV